jgi:pSer/pThr/pTyr-binding forkhead associated (FHA) protein
MPKFIIQNLKTKEEQEYELNQDSILFGRTNTSDIELPIKSVSRRHAEITREEQDYFITDLGSGNGTYLNNKRLPAEEKSLLKSGDAIRIEDYQILFLIGAGDGERALEVDTDTDVLEIKLIKKMMRALDSEDTPSMEVLNGVAAGKRVPIPDDKTEFTIGRGDDCDLSIHENILSRIHVKLEKKWGGIVIVDQRSKNGTFVNNEAVQEKLLRDGDRIMLGTIKLLYRNPKEVDLEIQHQELSRKKRAAAVQEAEVLAKKQLEEEIKVQEKADQERAQKEAEAKAVEEALEKEAQTKGGEAQETPASKRMSFEEAAAAVGKEKFSNLEKVFIVLGILVGLVAIGGLVMLFM